MRSNLIFLRLPSPLSYTLTDIFIEISELISQLPLEFADLDSVDGCINAVHLLMLLFGEDKKLPLEYSFLSSLYFSTVCFTLSRMHSRGMPS